MKTVIAGSLLLTASLAPMLTFANVSPVSSSPSNLSPSMERMTITYRSAIDYALYQYTIELLSHFRNEIHASIHQQAASNTLEMYKAFIESNSDDTTEITAMLTVKRRTLE
ncbi:hypothetical protein [Shewanella psychrotolerans]|uniref:hypothetical protein n=1 Tax=Shewanella psychrotolerans TaxID=2864206 RepID=UPI001C65CA5C|nr:hypothetical protein [Shewanella psychrotolerans]QYK02318.1 hypothetical protein K0I62_04940 [Shewanella psychrotolerans]